MFSQIQGVQPCYLLPCSSCCWRTLCIEASVRASYTATYVVKNILKLLARTLYKCIKLIYTPPAKLTSMRISNVWQYHNLPPLLPLAKNLVYTHIAAQFQKESSRIWKIYCPLLYICIHGVLRLILAPSQYVRRCRNVLYLRFFALVEFFFSKFVCKPQSHSDISSPSRRKNCFWFVLRA